MKNITNLFNLSFHNMKEHAIISLSHTRKLLLGTPMVDMCNSKAATIYMTPPCC